ncbi:MAG: phosphotransferase [Brevefilum sp.]|nr:phosphotransferase [Brevefilum sp.]
MTDYDRLTNLGKLRRLRKLALAGLSHYDLPDPQLTYHGFETNLMYRVTTARGERFMLRLAYPGWRTLADLTAEALWLTALSEDTDIPVPAVLLTRDGALVLSVTSPEVPDVWPMTLMRYVPGRLLGHYLTPVNLEKMGNLFARLHQHGADWTPPANFTTRRFEHWLSRGEPDLISSDGGNRENEVQGKHYAEISPLHRAWIDRMIDLVEEAYQGLDRFDLRVIHCDLWHDNIKLHQGVLSPFDFEDTVWGYRAHDIAMAMLDLLETVGEARYEGLLTAFAVGYQAFLPWPEARIEPFQIGRLLWKINWVAHHQPDFLAGMIERHIPVFEHFERTGALILPMPG